MSDCIPKTATVSVFIALGANLPHPDYGAPLETLQVALQRLDKTLHAHGSNITARGNWYTSKPVYRHDTPPCDDSGDYINSACRVQVQDSLSPVQMLDILIETEQHLGRVRSILDAPRTVDLDLLAWGNVQMNTKHLTLPHPALHKRAFVLAPLRDIAPTWRPPGQEKTVQELYDALPVSAQQDCSPVTAQESSQLVAEGKQP